ncbi:MAG: peptide chain release factor N(5)-glutamine methyltransferase [Candidatus Omnitrophota bacterium]|nr:peptide chain release factor N(5)-glutamine methyltransferase [Candidatus Omnitrophota bacterium]
MTEQELMLSSILGCSRFELYAKELNLSQQDKYEFDTLTECRANGEPLQYLLRFTEFMGLKFFVDRRVFIPRPETEILVEEVINLIKKIKISVKNILDIGTGSGNIAISLAKFLRDVKVTAVDISEQALRLAKENSILNKVDKRVEFFRMDFLSREPLIDNYQVFDLIVSNPPYINTSDLSCLPKEVRQEPIIALDGGWDGLKFYRGIIQRIDKFLKKSGLLALEMGFNQSQEIVRLLEQAQKFQIIKIVKDYTDIERVIIAREKKL